MNHEQLTMIVRLGRKPRSMPVRRLVRRSFSEDGSLGEGGNSDQSTMNDYAKQTQFPKSRNEIKLLFDKGL